MACVGCDVCAVGGVSAGCPPLKSLHSGHLLFLLDVVSLKIL